MEYTTVNDILMYRRNDMVVKDAQNGVFEPNTFRTAYEKLTQLYRNPKNFCAIDIGAYTGVYSIFFAKFCGFRTVYGFEPNPTVFERLLNNVNLNELINMNHIELHQMAVGKESGNIELFSKDFSMTSSSSMTKTEDTTVINNVIMTTLDELTLNSPVAIIKIDVEGHENDVLLGGEQLIKQDMPILIVETLNREKEEEITNMLLDFGYKKDNMIYSLDGRNMIAVNSF